MNISEAILSRRTVRGFLAKEVPEDILREIFDVARFSASNCNTQPWNLTVVSGELRQQLEREILEEISSGLEPAPAFKPGDSDLSGVYKERQHQCAAEYYGTMRIERSDKQARQELLLKNWSFFGAPHVGILSMPKTMGATNAIDIGIYLQSIMLLLVEYGLASCPQGALAYYPNAIHKLCDIPQDQGIICGLSFGYADQDALINTVKMPRADLSDTVTFLSGPVTDSKNGC